DLCCIECVSKPFSRRTIPVTQFLLHVREPKKQGWLKFADLLKRLSPERQKCRAGGVTPKHATIAMTAAPKHVSRSTLRRSRDSKSESAATFRSFVFTTSRFCAPKKSRMPN